MSDDGRAGGLGTLAPAKTAAGGDDSDSAVPVGERREDGFDPLDGPGLDLALFSLR